MSYYHTTGLLQAAFFMLAVYGLWTQLSLLRTRRLQHVRDSAATYSASAVLSLNQMLSGYLAYFLFLAYGCAVEEFNHYLVWTRLCALLLVGLIIFEIWRDRRALSSLVALLIVGVLMLAAFGLIAAAQIAIAYRGWFQIGIVIISVVSAQGYAHQFLALRRSASIGAVSWKMHFATLLKDLSGLAFGAAMGFKDGWPIALLNGTSAVTKVLILSEMRRIHRATQRTA